VGSIDIGFSVLNAGKLRNILRARDGGTLDGFGFSAPSNQRDYVTFQESCGPDPARQLVFFENTVSGEFVHHAQ